MSLSIGDPAPEFSLPDTDGIERGIDASAERLPATVIVFTCNHCPYAIAWHDRTAAVARDYAARGVSVLAINSNDAEVVRRRFGDRYGSDSPEAMRERVQRDGGWPMPYLHDSEQEVARAFGATTTPDVFVLDAEGRLAYRGAPDADYDDPSQDAAWLRAALDAILAGQPVKQPLTTPVGCSIKWKP